ncbi:MAG: hypothetical protein AD073_000017 [Mycoplasmataceae bacterium]|nr:MAG: hypothetical protein AD073_000017 [Mycoplasmataceae bacterium]
MPNANQWLEENYPQNGFCLYDEYDFEYKNEGKKRNEITQLNISEQCLEGDLDLADFVNLEELYCANNQLTSLDLSHCINLRELYSGSNEELTQLIIPKNNRLEIINARYNSLTTFEYSVLNPNTLKRISFSNNNLEPTDIAVFSHLINLTKLKIHSRNHFDKKYRSNNYNRFYGSLESLKNLTNLNYLSIGITDINRGLEYLSEKIRFFPNELFVKTFSIYKNDGLDWFEISLGEWKNNHSRLFSNAKIITELEQAQKSLKKAFSLKEKDLWWSRNELTINTLINPNNGFQLWTNEKINELKKENEEYYKNIEVK